MSKATHKLAVLDNLGTAVVLLNNELRIEYINPASEDLFQISSRQATDTPLDKIMYIDDTFQARLKNAFIDIRPISEYEACLQLHGGREIIIDYTLTPLQPPEQPMLLILEISHIDRHLRIAREEQLLSEQTATRNLIRGMAHEIKNPLGGLRGAAQLLERELPGTDLKEYTQIIIREADRLQSLVNRILGPNNVPRKRNINIHQVLEHVRQLIQAETPGNTGSQFKLDYDPSLPEIMADTDMMIQAVLNITQNAIQALDGSGQITFKTRPLRHFTIGHTHHRLVLKTDIIDNGPGIDENLQAYIFFPMVSGRAEGSGLGLSIAQTLINQHDGLIKMASRKGETIFSIYLPLLSRPEKNHG